MIQKAARRREIPAGTASRRTSTMGTHTPPPLASCPDGLPRPAPLHGKAETSAVVLFDGHCNFCSGVVNFLIDRDPRGRLRFASLQSEAGRTLLAEHGLPMPEVPDTMVLIEGDRVRLRSDAALATTRYLSGLWPLARVGFIVPRFLRDAIYKLVARNRYRWFGRTDACRIPTPQLRARFLD